MSLEVRKYKFEEGDSHDIFELELVPEVVDGVEVYNIQVVATDSTGIVEKKLAENKDQNNKITTKWEPL